MTAGLYKNLKEITVLFAAAGIILSFSAAHAGISKETARKAATAAEWAQGVSLHDYTLIDQDGKRFRLSEYFGSGKPLLVSFIYTSCGSACPTTTASLISSVKEVKEDLGDSFNVLTIDFNSETSTPEALKEYSARLGTGDMRYATGDKDTIERLTNEFGFFYLREGHGFDHLNMVSVIGADGRIYKQVYGIKVDPERIKKPLKELITGNIPAEKPPSIIGSIKMFCSAADPLSGKYVPNYPVIAGIVFQSAIILTILYAVAVRPVKSMIVKALHAGRFNHGR